ncbi:MAG: hypothetical protein KKI09_08635, partial [Spirochaetes bacterium]|nr:hypothetical protein [Spirochaetota bacterium]MBU0955477.1 hypothetical protein [Spirochaetota bacterium]
MRNTITDHAAVHREKNRPALRSKSRLQSLVCCGLMICLAPLYAEDAKSGGRTSGIEISPGIALLSTRLWRGYDLGDTGQAVLSFSPVMVPSIVLALPGLRSFFELRSSLLLAPRGLPYFNEVYDDLAAVYRLDAIELWNNNIALGSSLSLHWNLSGLTPDYQRWYFEPELFFGLPKLWGAPRFHYIFDLSTLEGPGLYHGITLSWQTAAGPGQLAAQLALFKPEHYLGQDNGDFFKSISAGNALAAVSALIPSELSLHLRYDLTVLPGWRFSPLAQLMIVPYWSMNNDWLDICFGIELAYGFTAF